MGEASPESSDSVSSPENGLVGFRSSSMCSFHRLTISPVRNFFEANQKSFSIASPNSPTPRFLLWQLQKPQPFWPPSTCLLHASGDPWANQARKASFFSLTASFPRCFLGCRHDRHRKPSDHTITHLDSMSPSSPGMYEKFVWMWELKTPQSWASTRRSQFTLTTRLGLPGLSGSLPRHLIQLQTGLAPGGGPGFPFMGEGLLLSQVADIDGPGVQIHRGSMCYVF
ncbi:hypothetical protein N1851_013323 [Merluccius polli]|uniref:Uncharacterized protein n=1 Tax=Merluccius polli TaxID=89951 RepID=A0AA47MW55_MERPO|nr:hypothetical protein N1851_013323 [Merluccius polli]